MGQDGDILLQAQQDADLFGKVQWLKYFCAASGIHWEEDQNISSWMEKGNFPAGRYSSVLALTNPAKSSPGSAGRAGSDLPFQAHSSQECFSPEELAGPDHRSLSRM